MATATPSTSGIALPSGGNAARFQSGKISRFLLRDRSLGYLFLAPALVVVLCLVAYPFVNAVLLTFQAKTAGAPGKWIGLNNYQELLNNPVFWRTVWNTIFYTAAAVALKFVFGLGMALVLNQERLFNNFYRSFLLIPWAVPTVISALNWRWIYDDASGLINNVLVRFELIDETISWLADPSLAMFSVIAVVVWQGTPFFTMGFLAGLQSISKELYEAAEIDGATVVQQFWHITIPCLSPIIVTVVMLSTILTSAGIQFVLILTAGGPADRTMIFPMLSYAYALGGAQRLGMGATVSLFFFPAFVILIYFLTRRMLREKEI
jgi:multiple sugar transport system permease protein